jgi:hypothetical protein
MPPRWTDEGDEQVNRIESGEPELSAENGSVRRRADDTHENIAAHMDGISRTTKELKELKNRADQQPPVSLFCGFTDSLRLSAAF